MRATLEQHQVWIYLAAILSGLAIGWLLPVAANAWSPMLWPLLGALIYTTFTQVPLTHLAEAFADRRFLLALLLGNFVIMPICVGLLLNLLPDNEIIRLGVLLVLLVPCTDWFITFTHLGRGDTHRAIAASPILLLLQILLLPLYIWLFMGEQVIQVVDGSHLLPVFAGLILLPLILAWVTERVAEKHRGTQRLVNCLGLLPVPLLTLVVFLIAATQVNEVLATTLELGSVLMVFLLYLLAAALLGKLLSHWLRLGKGAARTLIFSLGTRNSFVVLPLALALPELWRPVVVIIVFQSLVELFGMITYLRWVPGHLIRSHTSDKKDSSTS